MLNKGDHLIQVQVFDEEHEEDLSDTVNEFLATLTEEEVLDIKFSTAICCDNTEQLYCFSAMVLYRDKEEVR